MERNADSEGGVNQSLLSLLLNILGDVKCGYRQRTLAGPDQNSWKRRDCLLFLPLFISFSGLVQMNSLVGRWKEVYGHLQLGYFGRTIYSGFNFF